MGRFTIFDDAVVTEADLGNNFFVTKDHLGQPRANVVKELLLEMNEDVSGESIVKDPHDIIENDIDQFSEYTIVIATQIREAAARKLGKFCYAKNVPFIWMRINGLLGCIRLAFSEHTVVESHPEDDRQDLYIHPEQLKRFPKLKEYLETFDFTREDAKYYVHIPMVAVLVHFVKKWQAKHDGELPQSFAEKNSFAEFLKHNSKHDGLNFEEASAVHYKAHQMPRIPDDVKTVLKDPQADNIDAQTPRFWILVAALKQFMQNEGKGFLPVSTNIPDMTSESDVYVKLKQLYQEQAEQDVLILKAYVDQILEKAGLPEYTVPQSEVEYFARNCRNVACIRTRSLEEEYDPKTFSADEMIEETWDPMTPEAQQAAEATLDKPNLHWYFCLRAAEEFRRQHGRLPGTQATPKDPEEAEKIMQQDVDKLKLIAEKLYKDVPAFGDNNITVQEPYLFELCRFGGSELHNMGAMLGGVAAQVCLKLATQQYTPLNNTFMFNGMHVKASRWVV